jgi:hypothetical protein
MLNVGSSQEHGTQYGGFSTGKSISVTELFKQIDDGTAEYAFDGTFSTAAAQGKVQADLESLDLDQLRFLNVLHRGPSTVRTFLLIGGNGSGLVMHRHVSLFVGFCPRHFLLEVWHQTRSYVCRHDDNDTLSLGFGLLAH